MAVMDEFKEERANLKNKSLGKKIGYFWMYYKWYVLGTIFAVTVISAMLYSILTQKADAIFGIVLNGAPTIYEEDFVNGFIEYAAIDTEEFNVSFNSSMRMNSSMDTNSMGSAEFITVYTYAGDMDFMVADPWAFTHYTYNGIFADLSTLLDEQTLQELDGKILYMDASLMAEIVQLHKEGKSTDDMPLPNPFNPEEMKEPVPIGIDISSYSAFMDAYYYEGGTAYFAIINNAGRKYNFNSYL